MRPVSGRRPENCGGRGEVGAVNVAQVRFFSEALKQHVSYNVILPETGSGPFPVLMQLHGYTDDEAVWLYQSNLIRHARPYPLIIVLPNGGTSFYLNLTSAGRFGLRRYEDVMMQDLSRHVIDTFHAKESPWVIGGLSMGGFGAMRLGLKYPDRFASIWAHSGAYDMRDRDGLFTEVEDPEDADVFTWVERTAKRDNPPVISFDCGTDDDLIEENRRLHDRMDKAGLAHTYKEHPGGHTWDYWDEHVQEALAQHARVLGLAPVTT